MYACTCNVLTCVYMCVKYKVTSINIRIWRMCVCIWCVYAFKNLTRGYIYASCTCTYIYIHIFTYIHISVCLMWVCIYAPQICIYYLCMCFYDMRIYAPQVCIYYFWRCVYDMLVRVHTPNESIRYQPASQRNCTNSTNHLNTCTIDILIQNKSWNLETAQWINGNWILHEPTGLFRCHELRNKISFGRTIPQI